MVILQQQKNWPGTNSGKNYTLQVRMPLLHIDFSFLGGKWNIEERERDVNSFSDAIIWFPYLFRMVDVENLTLRGLQSK